MKINFKFLTMLLLVLFALAFGQAKKNVAVMEFVGKGMSDQDASMLADAFRSFLVNTGTFTVINRAHMEQILKEQAFQSSGCTDVACAVQIGKMLNMEYMFTGTASKFGETWMITIDMISVETSQIEGSKMKKVKGEMDILLDETEKVAIELASQVKNGSGSVASTTASVDSKSKNKQSVHSESSQSSKSTKPNKLKPVLIGAGAVLTVSGTGLATYAGLLPTIKLDKYHSLKADASESDFTAAYKEYEEAHLAANTRIIIFGAVGGVGLVSLIAGIASPSVVQTGYLIPTFDGNTVALNYFKKF